MRLGRNYKTIIIFIFFFHIASGFAQDTLNAASVEQKTYQLYLDKNWNELITYGNEAIEKGYDYFYLQLRVGIAYYEKKNYRIAEKHFLKALSFNSTDEFTKEHLYYSYLYAGKYDEARVFSRTFSKESAKNTGTYNASALSFFMMEGGIKKSDSTNYYDKHKKTNANYFDNAAYFQVGLGHYVNNRISLFHAFTYFNQTTFLGKTTQPQYYLMANIPVKKGWSVSPAIHWVHKNYTPDSSAQTVPPSGMGPPPRRRPSAATSTNYFVGSLTVKKSIARFDVTLGSTFSNIDSANQYIHSLSISYFPLGNNLFSFGSTYYLHTENNYSNLNSSVTAFISARPLKRISLTASYLYNQNSNVIESNGYLVNNCVDLTTARYSILANFSLGKHFDLYGIYQFENKQEAEQKFKYNYNVFLLGFKIIP
ncbi:MAG: tetratricopeptide repeat protein [Bacteroidia bacterium]